MTVVLQPSGEAWTTELVSVKTTQWFGDLIGRLLTGGEIIALTGELGTGKTALVRGIAAGLEIDPATVTSPTFTLIHEYRGRVPLIHADLYRLENIQDLANIGFYEYMDQRSVIAIEWAERLERHLPNDRLDITLEHRRSSRRKATLAAVGAQSRQLLEKICQSPDTVTKNP